MDLNKHSSLRPLLSFIWQFVCLQKMRFIWIFIAVLAWPLDNTVGPYLLRSLINLFTEHEGNRAEAFPALLSVLLWLSFLWIVVEAGFRAKNFLQAKAFPKLEADLRLAMFDHIQHHSPHYFNRHFSGNLANKISDMTLQATVILESLLLFVPSLILFGMSVFFFFQIHVFFACFLAGLLAIYLAIFCVFTPKSAQFSDIHGQMRSSLAGKIVDSLTNNFSVNLFFRFPFEKKNIEIAQVQEQEKHEKAKMYTSYMFLSMSVVFLLGMISLSWCLVIYWTKGLISTGEVVQIFNTTLAIFFAIWFVNEQAPSFFQALGLAKQAYELMNHPQDILDAPGASPLIVKKGEISFHNVFFQHGTKKLFEDKNVFIKEGEKIGLVGHSGAGKSTFINLILRLFPVEKGKILIDGQDISLSTLSSLRQQIALIPQDPLLFHRTFEENIRYGRVDATPEEIIEAAKQAHCHEFILKSKEGYQTVVGERGTMLSGGERQRIAIARAMLSKAPILILDEATSSLDSITEVYIQKSLQELMQNRTTIVIAHRLSTLAKMDRILVLDHGRIVEEGSHASLLAKQGYYAELWSKQVNGFLIE